MYTCMFSTKDGNTCFDPMLFHYPDQNNSYSNIERSFIVGDALKVSPVTWKQPENVTTYESWFPQGKWVNMNNFSDIINANETNGTLADLKYPAEIVNVHLRPGYIVPRQANTDAEASTINTVNDLRTKDYTLYINRDADGNAQGKLYLDKADTVSALDFHHYEDYSIVLNKK